MGERVIAGRYRLGEPLGVGGMAAVWTGYDLELERDVAVKLLAPDADPARFEREARAAAALTHPNICRLYDFGRTDEGPYMVLELLSGGSLEDRLSGGQRLPDDEAARVATELAAGLAHAHAHGLVHRDLKPANVLFDPEGRAKIADLGIARMRGLRTLTEAGTVLGTAATMSPEQARGEEATPASDVYSFGVILYRMLSGRLPFEADDPLELAAMHVREEPPPLSEIRPDAPARLESLVAAALAKDPADRPPDGTALLAELEGAAPTVPFASAGLPSAKLPGEPPARRSRPNLAAVLLASGLVLLGLAGLGVALALGEDPDDAPPPTTAAERPPATPPAADPEPPPSPSAPQTDEIPTETAPPQTEPPPPVVVPPPPIETTTPTEPLPTATEPPPTEPPPTTAPTTGTSG